MKVISAIQSSSMIIEEKKRLKNIFIILYIKKKESSSCQRWQEADCELMNYIYERFC